ncbi:hypothetical protein [Allonocardiopsis opalescens]|uniref:Uncharacterized protein n=1 Tax=Allonocardiopsis opalescens TaxID=1144618 RepID=A0A2T0Q7R4_9ACTN|nr:hypothetical protein [Allonocardiopsis opalescens]PRX99822.1 hypothetical protein CLV72_103429 [Allonocardiopsis opalescens]
MEPDTYDRPRSGPVPPETYWRRRVFVLAGVFGIIALVAWACSALAGPGDDTGAGDPGPAAASASPSPTPEQSVPLDPGSGASPSPQPSESPSGTPAPGASGVPADDAQPAANTGQQAGAPCAPENVVVTFDIDREVYAAGQEPRFEVTVVNTSDVMCTFDVAPEQLEVRVTSGSDRIWSNLDCAEQGTDPQELQRGVPHTERIDWDRMRSFTDCRDAAITAQPGTYVVRLYGDYAATAPEDRYVFHLR